MVAGLAQQKHALRQRIAERRRAVSMADASRAGGAVAAALLACPAVREARSIGLYAALPDELPTLPAFRALAGPRRSLALPSPGPGRVLAFRVAGQWEALVRGRWGVLAPPQDAPGIAVDRLDVVLLPGVAFDAEGNRLGRGGGYYDATFPPGAAGPLLIGLAWSFQLVDAVPHGSRDRRVDAIVSEDGCVVKPGRWK
ncbi:MAG: 5-formyltetrahydrofolate cyclo-ligase [Deltaproteobacteria bacterium]|nr:5-formyltetrahydrofolate cyclo-ligase [Deltaproteobacteria bacterium]MBW2361473.1 5-formyltetrahydrofolate cyclo-ligase [Deltaproteobacteria bacterium]